MGFILSESTQEVIPVLLGQCVNHKVTPLLGSHQNGLNKFTLEEWLTPTFFFKKDIL